MPGLYQRLENPSTDSSHGITSIEMPSYCQRHSGAPGSVVS
ncbi:hypothetical protein [Microcoleus sp. F4-D5]